MGTIPVVTHLVSRNECMPVGGDLLALLIVFYSLRSTSVTTFVTMVATAAPASFPITSFSLFECLLFLLLLLIFVGFNLTLMPLTYSNHIGFVFWVQI